MPTNITGDQVHAVYEVGKRVFSGALKAQEAVALLTDRHGMNRASAQAYTDSLQHILAGNEYRRTVNVYATRYFLNRIRRDFGRSGLREAVEAVKQHLDYYSGIGKSSMPATRAVVAEFAVIADSPATEENPQVGFYDQVRKSMADSSQSRRRRLSQAPKTPKLEKRTIRSFTRNPDVVAEVLIRASGFCERCNGEAPFTRAKDGTPYLEVHHKTRLADGGEDTVENALALCPNCHRELHFG